MHHYHRVIVLALALGACSDPPKLDESSGEQAVFTNPDFENDVLGAAPGGGQWTRTININPGITDNRPNPQTLASLNLAAGGVQETFVVGGATEAQTDPDLGAAGTLRFPKYGQRAVRVNYADTTDNGKNKNVNSLSQQMIVSSADVDPMDDQVHVRFTISPVLENPAHTYTQQPYYFIRLQNITTGVTLYQDFNVAGQLGVPWKTFTDASTNAAEYVDWSLVDVSPGSGRLSIGDKVELLVIAAGCSLNGHWARVYVDSFGENIPGLYTWAQAPQTVNVAANVTYRINYRNGGTTTTYGTKLDLVTPPSTTFQSTSLGAACTTPAVNATGTVSCSLGTLAPGADGSFTVIVQVAAGTAAGTVITNGNYSIYATNVSPLIGSKVSSTVTAASTYADVKLTVTDGKSSIDWGQPTSYTITVSNTGPAAATNITVTDPMPAQLTGVTWTCSTTGGGTCVASGSGNINSAASLPVGAVATYIVNATIIAGTGAGSVKNTVTAAVATQSDPDTSSNTVADVTAIGTPRALTVTKTTAANLGTIRSEPAGLTCGTSCAATSTSFANGAQVILDASPVTGATFVGWSGACTNTTTTCTVTMAGAQSVSARFAGPPSAAAPSGANQSTAISTAFGQPLSVTITDSAGTPIPGVSVAFAVPSAGASAVLSTTTATTNAAGVATVTVTANATPGTYSATATVPNIAAPVQFSLSNLGPPASITMTSGSPQSTAVTTGFAAPLVATVRDAANQVLLGVNVTFTAPGSGAAATPSPTTVATDASGDATLSMAANTIAGTYNVTASVPSVATPASFALTNVAGAGTTIAIVSGNAQSAAVTQAFGAAFVASLVDAFGNPVAGATISFAAPPSGATAALSSPAVTDAQGRTSVTGVASTTTGSFSITASAPGAASATFTATVTAGPPASIAVTGGNNQSPTVGTPFAAPLAVTVVDAFGNPVPGAAVAFAGPATGARATFLPGATTDAAGLAQVAATAGTIAGTYAITATVSGLAPVMFTVTNAPAAATAISPQAGSGQTTRVGTAFTSTLIAAVVDAFGNPVAGVTVSFAAPGSGASAALSPVTAVSNAAGLASSTATANPVSGSYTATASLAGGASASFALTNTPGPAASIAVISGSAQSARVGTGFTDPLIVEVRDALGNVVPNASVDFTVPGSGATATPSASTVATNASGRAQITATAGTVTGSYALTATVAGFAAAFSLTNTAGVPASIAMSSGSGQSAQPNIGFAAPLAAIVRDTFGNPVPGATVSFTAPGGTTSATLGAPTAITGSDGIAQITATAKTHTGSYTVTASVPGPETPASFALTNLAGDPASLVAISGGGQSTEVSTAFSNPLIVELRDAFDNVIVEHAITFTAPSSGAAAVVAASATSDGAGRAQVLATANPVAGAYQVVASVAGAPDATFPLTNTPGAAANVTITGGDGQSATVLQPLDQPLVVTVVDSFGNPVSGATVTLHAPDASGPTAQLVDAILTTGTDGTAQTTATAGRHAGSYDVTASIPGSTATFHLSSVAGPAAVVRSVAGGSPQSATVLTAFAAPLEVVVEDAFGNPSIGTSVVFAAPASGATASFSAPTVVTDADGHAQTTATANGVTGGYAATATVTEVEPAAFSLTNLAGAPTQATATGGDGQAAVVDTDFASALVVLIVDDEANPVPNASVTFAAPTSGATAVLAATSVATDATGHASVTVHAGTVTGTYTVTATTAGAAAPVQFTLTNTPGPAVSLIAGEGSTPQSATVNTAYAAPLTAILADQFGNGIPGVTIAFAAPTLGPTGTLSAPTAVTDASGRASVTITANTTAGPFAVTASTATVEGTAAFALTNLTDPVQLLSVRSGSQQSAIVTTAFGLALVARLQDQFGNPVAGAIVVFEVPATGATATLTTASAATNEAGEATTVVTAGTVIGAYDVTASTASGAAPIAFALTNLVGAPATATATASSTPQSAQVSRAFGAPLALTVFDAFGNRVAGVSVTFAAPFVDPRATLSATTVTTAADGTVSTLAVAGIAVGSYQVTASVAGISTPVSFELTNTVGAVSSLVAVSGAGQHAMATTEFAAPVMLRALDAFGNPVAGATVTLSTPATGSSGTLSSGSLISDASGLVTATLVANASPGGFSVVASVAGGESPISVAETIDPVPTATTIVLPASAAVGERITGTITVTAAILTPAGSVDVVDQASAVVGTAMLDGTGTATVVISAVARGHHMLTARFAAQGAFGASQSLAFDLEATQDGGRLTGAGTDCSAAGGSSGFGLLLVIGALLVARPRRRAPRARLAVVAGIVVAIAGAPSPASAQAVGARSVERMHPASPDSEWFALDSLAFEGHRSVALSVLGDYGYRPLVIYNADGSRRADIVRNQFVLHFSGSVTLFERFRLSASAPMAPYQDGERSDYNGMPLVAPTYAFGDVTVAGDIRIVGTATDRLRAAVGVRVTFPTGSRTNYLSDGVFAGDAHGRIAGTLSRLEYAADGQLVLRKETTLADQRFGSELRFSAALGVRLADGKLVLGPEMFGALPLTSGSDIGHPIELGGGAHYRVSRELLIGLGGTVGLVHAVGTPEERVMLSFAWLL